MITDFFTNHNWTYACVILLLFISITISYRCIQNERWEKRGRIRADEKKFREHEKCEYLSLFKEKFEASPYWKEVFSLQEYLYDNRIGYLDKMALQKKYRILHYSRKCCKIDYVFIGSTDNTCYSFLKIADESFNEIKKYLDERCFFKDGSDILQTSKKNLLDLSGEYTILQKAGSQQERNYAKASAFKNTPLEKVKEYYPLSEVEKKYHKYHPSLGGFQQRLKEICSQTFQKIDALEDEDKEYFKEEIKRIEQEKASGLESLYGELRRLEGKLADNEKTSSAIREHRKNHEQKALSARRDSITRFQCSMNNLVETFVTESEEKVSALEEEIQELQSQLEQAGVVDFGLNFTANSKVA